MFNRIKVDPITVEVLSNAFMSIAEEMGGILVRTAYSTNIKERKDCSCAIFNAKGETIAQAEHIPVHLGSMLGIVKEINKKYAPPGDPSGQYVCGQRSIQWRRYASAGYHACRTDLL